MNRFFRRVGSGLAVSLMGMVGGLAEAECTLQASANIPAYQALADTTGTLNVNVTCDRANEPYTIALTSPQSQSISDGLSGTLRLQVLTDRQTPLNLLLINAAKPLAGADGTVFRGTQQLQFVVLIPAGQWTVQGKLSEYLKFQLLSGDN
ncbi:hypothetical protein [Deinococcus irradiatisoli]|uniref:hypothetical protein n=1 Tax=Deinococcus irradiatisoli TaxID=2202254 RepID=UPI0011B27F8B|nr:hypothetical protein [Deinococcus irradiatisoli]